MTESSVFWLVKTFALLKVFMVALARICLLVDLRDFFQGPQDRTKKYFRFFFSTFRKITVGGFVNQLIKNFGLNLMVTFI